jgi:DNA polymerase III epsilon subunit-like protein
LKKYINDIEYLETMDTFNLSQTFVHFAPSYALEIINEILKDKKEFQKLDVEIDSTATYHDALYDSFVCYKVFCYFLNKIKYLIKKYPILIHYIKKSNSTYSKIFNLEEISKTQTINTNNLFLPPLQKDTNTKQKLYEKEETNFDEFKNKSNLYI